MKRSLLFVLLAIALTYAVRELEYAGVRRNKQGEFAKLRECFLEKNDYDMLYLGSSRAESQFHPGLIDSLTGLRSYNAGLLGATAPFMLTSLQGYLENSAAPKYVVLNIDYHSFSDNTDTIFQFARYFPYLSNKALYNGLQERDPRFCWFRALPFYSMPYFNSRYLNAAIRGYSGTVSKYDTLHVRGYSPVMPVPRPDIDTFRLEPQRSEPPAIVMQSFDGIVRLCKTKNIRLIFVLSPLHRRQRESLLNERELVAMLHRYAEKNQIPLLDYSQHPVGYKNELFADPAHLSREGSLVFSRFFARDVLPFIERRHK